jgi:hypothetical protein
VTLILVIQIADFNLQKEMKVPLEFHSETSCGDLELAGANFHRYISYRMIHLEDASKLELIIKITQ